MTFYLKPPRGLLCIFNIEKCIEQRLLFYNEFSKGAEIDDCYECLIEDSALDRTGHFMLRLLAIDNPTFRNLFLNKEVKLLDTRLNSYNNNASDLKIFLKRLIKHSADNLGQDELHDVLRNFYLELMNFCSRMLQKPYLNHIQSKKHSMKRNCDDQLTIDVPFHLCPSLLPYREITLTGGFLKITCKHWRICFLSMYEHYLRTVLNLMKFSPKAAELVKEDRIKQILANTNIIRLCRNDRNNCDSKFNIFDIENQSKLFPLCMQNLYQTLKSCNRLPHNERFYFGLYLKGIGVPVEDAMKFWEIIYSKQHSTCSKCTHDWKSNEKRYIYGIKHLYGLTGSRRQYNTKTCYALQNLTLGPRDCGGCPFRHFDDENLKKLLSTSLDSTTDIEDLMKTKTKNKDSQTACQNYYRLIHQTIIGRPAALNLDFQDPVEYFQSLKNAKDCCTL